MNVQRLFDAIRNQPDQATIIVAVIELERQGYEVLVNGKYMGSSDLARADETGELDQLPVGVGLSVSITKPGERQSFRIHILDLDAVALTDEQSPPVIYNPDFTVSDFR